MAKKFIKFKKWDGTDGVYYDVNNNKGEFLGNILYTSVGRKKRWAFSCSFVESYYDSVYFTPGCLRQIADFIDTLT